MNSRTRTLLVGGAVALVLFVVMALIVRSTEPWAAAGADNTAQANDLSSVVDTLFGPQVIAFEILGILLTAAMIGALVIARPLGVEADESHYTHPSPEQVKESLAVSDVRTHHLEANK